MVEELGAIALAAGCTRVVMASSQASSHAFILADVIDAQGLPTCIFNLVHSSGRAMSENMCSHPEVDSFNIRHFYQAPHRKKSNNHVTSMP